MQPLQNDQEAIALAQCYALLIQKAQERRAQLAKLEASKKIETTVPIHENQEKEDQGGNNHES